jgi:signal transduction histidine kinase
VLDSASNLGRFKTPPFGGGLSLRWLGSVSGVPALYSQLDRWFRSIQVIARRHPVRFDAAVGIFLAFISVFSNQEVVAMTKEPKPSFGPLQVVCAFALGLPFAWRRLAPFWCLVACVGLPLMAFALHLPDPSVGFIVLWFAIHAIAMRSTERSLLWGRRFVVLLTTISVIGAAIATVLDRSTLINGSGGQIRSVFLAIAGIGAFIATAWLSGWLGRGREAHIALLAERATELEQQRDVEARQAVQDERLRIAREVHDVVAHHVSVMGVQAGAARMMVQRDPDRAAAVISQIEESSRSAIADLSRLVMFLREKAEPGADETPGSTSVADLPQPSIEQVDDLLADAKLAGMDLTVNTTGVPNKVPASVGLCAYRIVQEALTNIRKHAGHGANTVVDLFYGTDRVEVSVQNRGRIGIAQKDSAGHGIVGMRERVGLVGGQLSVGPVAGGYRVHAILPFVGNVKSAGANETMSR